MKKPKILLDKLLSIAEQTNELKTNEGSSYKAKKIELLKKERNTIVKELDECLYKLSPIEYKIFNLRYIQGKSHRAIAKKLNYSLSTITHKIADLNKKLGT